MPGRAGAAVAGFVAKLDVLREQTVGLNLRDISIDKYTGNDTGICQAADHLFELRLLSKNIKPAFGRNLMPTFRDQHGHFGFQRASNADHFIRCSHLQIQFDLG